MIKITKPSITPAVLSSRGTHKRNAHCREYALHSLDYQGGESKFNFDATIYGHKDVKDALVAAQHKKCCFCESQVGHDGDVEHFRPKGGYHQNSSQKMVRPGYFWLAYDWENLFLSCSACNQRNKGNLFPLQNPSKRAITPKDSIVAELPLFVDPAKDNPEQFISFRKEIPYAIRGNSRGNVTIEALGLRRDIMNERRRSHLAMLATLQNFVNLENSRPQTKAWKKAIADAKRIIAGSTNDDALFAGAVRAAQRGW